MSETSLPGHAECLEAYIYLLGKIPVEDRGMTFKQMLQELFRDLPSAQDLDNFCSDREMRICTR